eukprot:g29664.t1
MIVTLAEPRPDAGVRYLKLNAGGLTGYIKKMMPTCEHRVFFSGKATPLQLDMLRVELEALLMEAHQKMSQLLEAKRPIELFVSGLPPEMGVWDLEDWLVEFGPVDSIELLGTPSTAPCARAPARSEALGERSPGDVPKRRRGGERFQGAQQRSEFQATKLGVLLETSLSRCFQERLTPGTWDCPGDEPATSMNHGTFRGTLGLPVPHRSDLCLPAILGFASTDTRLPHATDAMADIAAIEKVTAVLPDFQSTDLAETGEKLQVHLVEMTKTQLETKQTIQAVLSLEKEPVDNTTSHRSQ